MPSEDQAGLTEQERDDLTDRARRKIHRIAALLAALTLVALVTGLSIALSEVDSPGAWPPRTWLIVVAIVIVAALATAAPLVIFRRRARHPELLEGADRTTRSAVRRALRVGYATDPHIDALARDSARQQMNRISGRRRWLLLLFPISVVLVLAGLVLGLLSDGLTWRTFTTGTYLIMVSAGGVWLLVYVRHCRRYLANAATRDGDHGAYPGPA